MLKKSKVLSEAEFENIYKLYWKKLYGLAYNYFRDKTTAEELVQNLFIKLWQKRDEVSHVDDIQAYLFKCMKNLIYDQYDKIASQQKLKNHSAKNFREESHPVEELIDYQETLSLINQELDKLPPTTRAIFRMSKFDRHTNDEIATMMRISAKAVEYHITRALKKLRIRLQSIQ